VSWSAIIE